MKTIVIGCLILVGWLAAGTAYYTCKTHCRCGSSAMASADPGSSGPDIGTEGSGEGTTDSDNTEAGTDINSGELDPTSSGDGTDSGDSTASGSGESGDNEEGTDTGDAESENEPEEIRLEGESLTRKTLYCNYKSPHFEEDDQLSEYAKDIKAFLDANPGTQVYITGHTDNVGGIWYNRRLGRERAQNFSNYLANHKVPVDRMVVDTEGKAQPIADNSSEAGRKQNRRVEITIK